MKPCTPPTIDASAASAPGGARANGAVAFGPEAERYLAGLPADLPVIACDGTRAAEALAEAAARRRAGARFFVAPLLESRRATLARGASWRILAQYATLDERSLAFEQLAAGSLHYEDAPLFARESLDAPTLGTLRELAQTGDALLARSQAEAAALRRRLRVAPAYVGIASGAAAVPDVVADPDARGVVVWAPRTRAVDLGLVLYALWHLRTRVDVVCEGAVDGSPHRFLAPEAAEAAEAALRGAAVVVDVELASPATALAFADRGYGVVAALTSGAHESACGLETYDPTDAASVLQAVARARAHRRTARLAPDAAPEALRALLERTRPPALAEPPLVSVLIPTYNRREELRACLASLAAQTYPNLEAVVVDDAGEAVDDVVAAYPFARLVRRAENGGVNAATNDALRHARGAYVALLADDDRKYPDAVAAAMAAIAASGLPVAHADVLMRLDTRDAAGRAVTYGHLLFYENANDPTAVLWGGSASHLLGYAIERELFAAIGGYDVTAGNAADCDAILKLSAATDFAHVRSVQGEQSYRDDRTNGSAALREGLPRIVEAVYLRHLPPGRPLVAQRQRFNVEATAQAQTRTSFFLPRLPLAVPIAVDAPRDADGAPSEAPRRRRVPTVADDAAETSTARAADAAPAAAVRGRRRGGGVG